MREFSNVFLKRNGKEYQVELNSSVKRFKDNIKNNYDECFYIPTEWGEIVFSSEQAFLICELLNNPKVSSVKLIQGTFDSNIHGYFFKDENKHRYYVQRTGGAINLSKWLQECLTESGYISNSKKEAYKQLVKSYKIAPVIIASKEEYEPYSDNKVKTMLIPFKATDIIETNINMIQEYIGLLDNFNYEVSTVGCVKGRVKIKILDRI